MFEIRQSATSRIPIKMVSDSDFATSVTGVTSPSVFFCSSTGTSTSASFSWAAASNANMPGLYWITPTSAVTATTGPLMLSVVAAGCAHVALVVNVVANLESDTYTQAKVSRQILKNKTVDNNTTVVLYDDTGVTEIGRWTWANSTGTRTPSTTGFTGA